MSALEFRFRPLPVWPHPDTPADWRRGRRTFKADWSDTLLLLQHELKLIDARELVIGADFREQDLRRDGMPRSSARQPEHPGIEVSLTTPTHGRLVYATDTCVLWQHNVRSVALGLAALRAVDRYGITQRGQQYAGFRQLTAGGPSVDRGRQLIREHGSPRAAQIATHPDRGGDAAAFTDVQAAIEAGAR